MSASNVINLSAVRTAKNKEISTKVAKLVFVHNEINKFEDELNRLQYEFKTALNNRSYPQMQHISSKMLKLTTRLGGYREYEQLVMQNKI